MSKNYNKHYHLQMSKSLDDDIKKGLTICNNKYDVKMSKAEFIRMALEHFLKINLTGKHSKPLENALKDMRYI